MTSPNPKELKLARVDKTSAERHGNDSKVRYTIASTPMAHDSRIVARIENSKWLDSSLFPNQTQGWVSSVASVAIDSMSQIDCC
jgi:hypothetical protein